jgi:hypothetical protein
MEVIFMFKRKNNNLFDKVANKLIEQENKNAEFSNRIDSEIKEHKEHMKSKRDGFTLIRNK